ncbi:MAG TPA: 2Fe-2S iron-sulfur cluster-binding protein [Methylovirgula sp.]|nr:2Fe-2S iron-sulfur cluster-binding protein [Methylovirgula sp.]
MSVSTEIDAPGLNMQRVKARRAREGTASASIYLSHPDGGELPPFKPGQWVEITLPSGETRPFFLSAFFRHPKTYRITVLRQPTQAAVANFLLDELVNGQELLVSGPFGDGIPEASDRPLVVVSRGIGSIVAATIAEALAQTRDRRPAVFFLGERHDADLILGAKIRSLQAEMRDTRFVTVTDQPLSDGRQSGDQTVMSDLNPEGFAAELPFGDCDYALCGATAFVEPLAASLRARNVSEQEVIRLSFGDLTLEHDWAERSTAQDLDLTPRRVSFAGTGVEAIWHAEQGTLLDLAIAQGLKLPFSCRTGMCGTCAQQLLAGRVAQIRKTSARTEAGQILLCSTIPQSDVEIVLGNGAGARQKS